MHILSPLINNNHSKLGFSKLIIILTGSRLGVALLELLALNLSHKLLKIIIDTFPSGLINRNRNGNQRSIHPFLIPNHMFGRFGWKVLLVGSSENNHLFWDGCLWVGDHVFVFVVYQQNWNLAYVLLFVDVQAVVTVDQGQRFLACYD